MRNGSKLVGVVLIPLCLNIMRNKALMTSSSYPALGSYSSGPVFFLVKGSKRHEPLEALELEEEDEREEVTEEKELKEVGVPGRDGWSDVGSADFLDLFRYSSGTA